VTAHPGLFLTTTAFTDGAVIPDKFTSRVASPASPKLEWTNVPAGTASFALILHDLDEAIHGTSADVLHWLAFNISGTARELPEGIPPTAQLADGSIQAKNHNGGIGYLGPGAPAVGPLHHYSFELFALNKKLDLGVDATRAHVLEAMEGHILGKSVVVGRSHL
jgi:Raf kinase inhibitor-like YbhB/YbcL family protein